ncbi:HTH-type transcriptional activator RhaR [compost metagenome]
MQLDTNSLYVEEDGLITSAGAGAGLDCCLHVVSSIYGSAEANEVARRMVIPTYREGRQTQKVERIVPTSNKDTAVATLLGLVRADPVRSYKLDCLAKDLGMSRSTFTRYFRKMTGMSFGEWLLSERLKRSQELLETSLFDIETVAEKTGFQNANSLRQHFKEHFGVSPLEWRQTYRKRMASERLRA